MSAPVKVRAPEVEVTVVPEPIVVASVTLREVAPLVSVCAPFVTRVLPTMVELAIVIVEEPVFEVRRL